MSTLLRTLINKWKKIHHEPGDPVDVDLYSKNKLAQPKNYIKDDMVYIY